MDEIKNIPAQKILDKINALSKSESPAPKKELLSLCNEVTEILSSEVTDYRKPVSIMDEIPGGLIDFTGAAGFDYVIIPDLHARKELICQILTYPVLEDGKTVFDCLAMGKIKLFFQGDILHSESREKKRWLDAFDFYKKGNCVSEPMKMEMTDGISVLMQVMTLKKYFPENVHCIKGNHENIKNVDEDGNFSFGKYVCEGSMVRDFIIEYYGEKVLNAISAFEHSLPLGIFFDEGIITHAEPKKFYTREDIIDSPVNTDVIYGLTWTKNDEAEDGSVQKMLDLINSTCKKKKYIAGHRPVKSKYALRQNGDFVQIHNPVVNQFVFIKNGKDFDPESDIIVINSNCGEKDE